MRSRCCAGRDGSRIGRLVARAGKGRPYSNRYTGQVDQTARPSVKKTLRGLVTLRRIEFL